MNSLRKFAYMLPKCTHTFAYCNYRVFLEYVGKLITNTSVFMFMSVCSKKLSVPSDLFEFCIPENEYISTRVFFFFSVGL